MLLASGFSTRFGSSKLLAIYNDRTLIEHSIATLAPCDRIIAVVRVDDKAVQSLLNAHSIDCVFNTEPKRGMGHSIACAVKATSLSSGWCLLPADMPCIDASVCHRLVQSLQHGARIAAPFYRDRRGHPVAFSNHYHDALSALDGDSGARSIIQRNAEHLTAIDTDDAGVLLDVDSPVDMAKIAKQGC